MALILEIILVGLALCSLMICVRMIIVRPNTVLVPHVSRTFTWDGGGTDTDPHVAVPDPVVDGHGSVSEYRVRPGRSLASSHWDPFAEEQSRVHRVQAARRRTRPHKGMRDAQFVSSDIDVVLNHYTLLGVRPEATTQEIEQAYRRYAAEIHPDKFFDDRQRRAEAEKKFKQLNAIMQVLRDPDRRAAYDVSR